MTDRRAFLRYLGMAPAAPLAAKAVADKAIGEMIGLSSIPPAVAPSMIGVASSGSSPGDWKARVLRFIADKTLPEWFDDELRHRYRQVSYLDPDIACKRTWSMAVKIATQRQRNIERAKSEAIDGPLRNMRQQEFSEKFGVWI